jgi:NADH-quinone oxidoreductase subunit L
LGFLATAIPGEVHHHAGGGLFEYLKGSLAGAVGISAALALFILYPETKDVMRSVLKPLEVLCERKFFVDELYDAVVVRPLAALSRALNKGIEENVVLGGGAAVGVISRAVGEVVCRLTSGQVATYALFMLVAIATLIGLFV